MYNRHRFRLVMVTVGATLLALASAPLVGAQVAYCVAAAVFVVLCFMFACQSWPASLSFGLAYSVFEVIHATQGPFMVNGRPVAFWDFPWNSFLLLLFGFTPVLMYLLPPVLCAGLSHFVLARTFPRRKQVGA